MGLRLQSGHMQCASVQLLRVRQLDSTNVNCITRLIAQSRNKFW